MHYCEPQELVELVKIAPNWERLIKSCPGEIRITGRDKNKSARLGGCAVTGIDRDLIVTPVSSDPQRDGCRKQQQRQDRKRVEDP
jgi:hypothetical protein